MRRLALAGAIGLLLLSSTSVFAATNNQVWRATLSGPVQTTAADTVTVHGGATLALVGNGSRASVAVKLYDVMPKWTLSVSVTGTPATINIDTFRVAGPAVHRFWLKPDQVAALKTALAGTSPSLGITVQVMVPQPNAAPLASTLTGTFAKVTGSSSPAPKPAPQTMNQLWRSTLPDTVVTAVTPNVTIHGGATLALVGNGSRASVAVKLYGVKPAWTVAVTLNGSSLISRNHAAGPAVHRFWLGGSALTALKTAIAAKQSLTISVTVLSGTTTLATYSQVPLVAVTH